MAYAADLKSADRKIISVQVREGLLKRVDNFIEDNEVEDDED